MKREPRRRFIALRAAQPPSCRGGRVSRRAAMPARGSAEGVAELLREHGGESRRSGRRAAAGAATSCRGAAAEPPWLAEDVQRVSPSCSGSTPLIPDYWGKNRASLNCGMGSWSMKTRTSPTANLPQGQESHFTKCLPPVDGSSAHASRDLHPLPWRSPRGAPEPSAVARTMAASGKRLVGSADRLSDLHDGLLHSIMSFRPGRPCRQLPAVDVNEMTFLIKATICLKASIQIPPCKLLFSLINVKDLQLTGFQTLANLHAGADTFPVFHNVRALMFDDCDLSDNFDILEWFLNNAPGLEKLTLQCCKLPKASKGSKTGGILNRASLEHKDTLTFKCPSLKWTEIRYKYDVDVQKVFDLLLGVWRNLQKTNIVIKKTFL
ncbi:hypothetical protein ZWY2020_021832 [Hordeum vulgare]|nr:hypothetical protein ZWY2020_021832 [Hordeum vulgare]